MIKANRYHVKRTLRLSTRSVAGFYGFLCSEAGMHERMPPGPRRTLERVAVSGRLDRTDIDGNYAYACGPPDLVLRILARADAENRLEKNQLEVCKWGKNAFFTYHMATRTLWPEGPRSMRTNFTAG